MSSKRSKGSGASFRKAKRLKNLAADSEICSKITSFFTSVAPNATPLVASVCDHTATAEMATASTDMSDIDCETEHPVKSPVAIEPAEPLMTLVPASEHLLPPTCSAVELHPDPLDECHPLEHPAIKHSVTPVVCPVECLNEPASFSMDNAKMGGQGRLS